MNLDGDGPPDVVTFYYDPLLEVHHRLSVRSALGQVFYLLPQREADARRLFEGAARRSGWLDDPPAIREIPRDPRLTLQGMAIARELGMDRIYRTLAGFSEAHHEPSWDRERGEFTWGFGLGEAHPRGQFNATAAWSECLVPGRWRNLFAEPNLARLAEPTVAGVDFPTLLPSRAWWDGEARTLHVTTVPVNSEATGAPTRFRIENLPDPGAYRVERDGVALARTRVVGAVLEVETTVGAHGYRVRPL